MGLDGPGKKEEASPQRPASYYTKGHAVLPRLISLSRQRIRPSVRYICSLCLVFASHMETGPTFLTIASSLGLERLL